MILYRLVMTLAAPVILGWLVLRLLSGRERASDLAERLGGGAPGQAGAIWVHGASNGELTSARPLIEALAEAHPDRPLFVTANSLTGRALAAGWGLPRLRAALAPIDTRWALARVLRRWRPALLLVLENELWANRLTGAARAGVPVVVAGARISARSAARWGRAPGLMRAVLASVRYLSAQDPMSRDRFLALGLPAGRAGPVLALKARVRLAPPPADELARLAPLFPRGATWLAASTHPGEEAQLLDAFARARTAQPGLKLILAPRHPGRGPALAAEARGRGWHVARRGAGEAPGEDTDLYLADTLGEMALWYALAGVCFVGGSLVPRGGHTPFEPAQAGTAILHGPHSENFAGAYAALDAGGGAMAVADAGAVADALLTLQANEAREALAERAAAILGAADQQAFDAVLAGIGALIGTDAGPLRKPS